MTDNRNGVHGYSRDKQIYRRDSISMRRKASTTINMTSKNYYSNRNCPEILSLFALTNKQLEDREKQIYRSITNDTNHFNIINYPIQSPTTTTPIPNLILENDNKQDKQPMFPKLTARSSPSGKKFPTLRRSSIISIVDNNNSMPIIRPSIKSISSSLQKSSQNKIPIVSIGKSKQIQQLPKHLHDEE